MMYTIGRKEVLEKKFARFGENYQKMGSKNAIDKGTKPRVVLVFETQKQADSYLETYKLTETHCVAGIEATLQDVELCKFGPWYTLVNSARMIQL